jgi:hypothetical protein
MNTTDALIAALEDALALLKRDHRKDQAAAPPKVAMVIRKGESAIRQARQAERDNAVMIKPQPRGVRIDGWDVTGRMVRSERRIYVRSRRTAKR